MKGKKNYTIGKVRNTTPLARRNVRKNHCQWYRFSYFSFCCLSCNLVTKSKRSYQWCTLYLVYSLRLISDQVQRKRTLIQFILFISIRVCVIFQMSQIVLFLMDDVNIVRSRALGIYLYNNVSVIYDRQLPLQTCL